ncbi:MAG: AmmeMemoRadiSam system protein B [Angelakisella sp.]
MNKIIITLLIAGLLASCGSTARPLPAQTQQAASASAASPEVSEQQQLPMLNTIHYDKTLFYSGIGDLPTYTVEGTLTAGMVPHHLVASDMIAAFFAMAAKQPAYDGILIVSPSHFPENCHSMMVTAKAGWNTPFGVVKPYVGMIDRMLENKVMAAENNPIAVELDHGAAGLVPFIKHYLPDTPVAVCLVQGKLPRERLTALWEVIAAQRETDNLLVISSADCSHYLMPEEAAKRDAETMKAIEEGLTEQIFRFDDDHVDSPQSVNTFLQMTKQTGAVIKRLDHGSSDKKLPDNMGSPIYREGITTYLVYAGVKAPSEAEKE